MSNPMLHKFSELDVETQQSVLSDGLLLQHEIDYVTEFLEIEFIQQLQAFGAEENTHVLTDEFRTVLDCNVNVLDFLSATKQRSRHRKIVRNLEEPGMDLSFAIRPGWSRLHKYGMLLSMENFEFNSNIPLWYFSDAAEWELQEKHQILWDTDAKTFGSYCIKKWYEDLENLAEIVLDFFAELCKMYHRVRQEYIESIFTIEYATELFDGNGYLFYANGDLANERSI